MPQITFTDRKISSLPIPSKGERQQQYFERQKRGLSLVLCVSYGGERSWRALFYADGRPRTKKIGTYPATSLKEAREKAFEFDPEFAAAAAKSGSFKKVADEWFEDHVERQGLRSKTEIRRRLDVYVLPDWGKRPIFEIDRDDVSKLLRKIEKGHGTSQADAVLATISGVFSWFTANGPASFRSPLVAGMRRDKRSSEERKRKRILTDDEIRIIWNACEDDPDDPTYARLIQLLLLTGQRLRKVAGMQRTDLKDGAWTIRTEPREKGNAGMFRLPQMALDRIEKQPKIKNNPHVFPADRGKGPFNRFSEAKAELDRSLPKGFAPWTQHDVRRTHRTLLSRAGVDRELAERIMGHKLQDATSTEDVYDRHPYFEEKSSALQKLADLVHQILHPSETTNVVPLSQPRRR